MLKSTRLLTTAVLGVLGLGASAAAFQSTNEREMLVAVWTESGQILTQDTEVLATTAGAPVKGLLQPSGHFVLPNAGTATDYGMKATLEVQHPFYGTHAVDVSLDAAADVTLDLVFGLDGTLRALGDAVLRVQQREQSGFGGIVVSADECADAAGLAPNSSVFGTTIGATVDDVAACGTALTAPGVWYTVTGTGNAMSATTCSPSTDFDTKISVYCGNCDGLNCIGGNDDDFSCPVNTLQSSFTWCSQEGATYYILVHGFDVNVGDFELTLSDGDACADPVGCLPTGACCVDGSCSILNPVECSAAGGDYQGDFTECSVLIGNRVFSSGTLNLAIPDFEPAGVSTSLMVPNHFRIADVNLELTIDHTFTGDLQVFLEHDGVEVLVIDRPGEPLTMFGCPEDNWVGVSLDDEGSGGPIEDQCLLGGNLGSPPAYTPNNPLSAFDTLDSQGTWNLRVVDNANLDTGTLISWKLVVSKGNGATLCDQVVLR